MSDCTLRVFFYVQHLLGIGHLMRASRIATALVDNGFHVTLVTGGVPVEGFKTPGVNHVALPPIAVSGGDFAQLVDADGKPIDDGFKRRRCQLLLEAYQNSHSDIVILEAFPFGRRQVRFELLPLIDAVEATVPKPLLVTSLRDVLQRRSKPGRDEQTAQLVKQHVDKVLVHGDSTLATLGESFPCVDEIVDQIVYTGLVCGPRPKLSSERFDIIVSAGGGAVGATLVQAAMEAAALLPEIASWCVITGPNLPSKEFDKISDNAPINVALERFRNDFPSLLCSAELSISQAGYNTVSDILQARCRALLVPYSAQGETEQSDRASMLNRLGLAKVLNDELLTGKVLASAIRDALAQSRPIVASSVNTDGARCTAQILRELVSPTLQD